MGRPGSIPYGKERNDPMEQSHPVTPEILSAFGLAPTCPVTPLKGGHINDTFLVEDQGKFTLQRINRYVFPSPENIMETSLASRNSCVRRSRTEAVIPTG